MQAFIEGMPKAELHVHIEGTLEPELSFALAEKNGIELPFDSPEALIAAYDFHDLFAHLHVRTYLQARHACNVNFCVGSSNISVQCCGK